jgi:archaellum component FlaC
MSHVRSDVADIKGDLRSFRDKMDGMDARLNARIDSVADRLDDKFDSAVDSINKRFEVIDQRLDAIDQRFSGIDQKFDGIAGSFESVHQAIATTRLWGMSTLVTFSAVILATMTRGFGWL